MFRTSRAVVLGAALLVALTGCSSGSKSPKSSPTTASPTASGPTTTLRPVDTSFTGQGSAAFCNLAKTYSDQSKTLSTATTPTQLRTTLRDGRAAIDQAVSAAPAEIKSDVAVLAAAFGDVVDAFDKAGYDPNKVPATALAKLQAPEFQTATIRLQAYLRTICKVS